MKYLVTSDGCDWFARHFINIVLISPTHLLHVENAFYHGAVPPHRIKGTYAMHITSMNCVLNLILRTIFEGTYVHIYCDVIFRIQHTAFSQETLSFCQVGEKNTYLFRYFKRGIEIGISGVGRVLQIIVICMYLSFQKSNRYKCTLHLKLCLMLCLHKCRGGKCEALRHEPSSHRKTKWSLLCA